jgi:hypothetical protein
VFADSTNDYVPAADREATCNTTAPVGLSPSRSCRPHGLPARLTNSETCTGNLLDPCQRPQQMQSPSAREINPLSRGAGDDLYHCNLRANADSFRGARPGCARRRCSLIPDAASIYGTGETGLANHVGHDHPETVIRKRRSAGHTVTGPSWSANPAAERCSRSVMAVCAVRLASDFTGRLRLGPD